MAKLIDTLLLLALPASGKSEVRRFLETLGPEQSRDEFGLGPTVQLDDYPYVHLMRRIDEVILDLGATPRFFHSQEQPFLDGFEWGTLIALVNEDYVDLHERRVSEPAEASLFMFDRIDKAREAIGQPPKLSGLDAGLRKQLAERLEVECRQILSDKHANYPDSLDGKTIVIEFARGGPDGSAMPLPTPYGYQYSLSVLAPELLQRARVLYIWVTPEESRRKNDERARPDEQGSILHHGVPEAVMRGEYGCDDIEHLLARASAPNTIAFEAHGRSWQLPLRRFDNRVDKTSFVREDEPTWPAGARAELHRGLAEALSALAAH